MDDDPRYSNRSDAKIVLQLARFVIAGRLDRVGVCCRGPWVAGNKRRISRMVSAVEKTFVQSAELDFRSGLDDVVFDDGNFRMAGLEVAWTAVARIRRPCFYNVVPDSVTVESAVVSLVFRAPFAAVGVGGDWAVVAGGCGDNFFRLAFESSGRQFAVAVSTLDFVCGTVKLLDLATQFIAELISRQQPSLPYAYCGER